MKTVGLVTFPRYWNYGTQLQLVALQTVIERLAYRCEVIDYARESRTESQPSRWERAWQRLRAAPSFLRSFNERLYERRVAALTATRGALFQRFFEQHIRLGKTRYRSFEEIRANPPSCDAFVVGSDQVWNPHGHWNDQTYYLAFAPHSRRVAYAPSIGVSELPSGAAEWMRGGLEDMAHLSVREPEGARLIHEVCGREAAVVLDPTLLLSQVDWRLLAVTAQQPRPYVLCYVLQSDVYIRDRAREIAERLGADLVMIPVNRRDIDDPAADIRKAWDVGPAEFLGLIAGASCVCTDSFHGTVLSILFRRPFFVFRRYADSLEATVHSRIDHLLSITGLTHREMTPDTPIPPSPETLDYARVSELLEPWREKSLSFLDSALRDATRS